MLFLLPVMHEVRFAVMGRMSFRLVCDSGIFSFLNVDVSAEYTYFAAFYILLLLGFFWVSRGWALGIGGVCG